MEPLDIVDTQNDKPAGGKLNAAVAITVALLATFMGICKVKDDNINQAMQQAQANRVDHWNYYQARNLREEMARATLTQLKLAAVGRPAAEQAGYQGAISEYQALAAEQFRKKAEAKAAAEQDQKDYDALNFRDDQFDLSDTLLAIAISLLAITALTQQRGLYVAALVPTAFGVLMGLAGLAGWPIHPNGLIALLS
ncbi:DUF4337 domain-containing protein [Duganella sp. FT3S]|uniref:DUF4337 domain-containing protein n=1 Tax=Rugamonas fusca TaxID=2758568 RepID=A0A7W2EIR5_9BURK|nr:DUF4337 domain-containing protein [Rugamonas fusca]MBA5606668.1 DUF4337 domain-containing protein [Rugamonas fusca]